MSETSKTCLRCIINGELFDFNEDLGAVQVGSGAACTKCMDLMWPTREDLTNGPVNDMVNRRPKKIGYFGKLRP